VARLRPPPTVVEIAEATGTAAEIRRREGLAIVAALPGPATLVALDIDGEAFDSAALAARVERWASLGRPIVWLIGGAEGIDPAVLARADHLLSLGRLTWPHLLVRVLLAEQLFRAQCIATGHPYHRSWRP
jgi:23S rRNA (pseudouridine1915-N3)-methyltransferase